MQNITILEQSFFLQKNQPCRAVPESAGSPDTRTRKSPGLPHAGTWGPARSGTLDLDSQGGSKAKGAKTRLAIDSFLFSSLFFF
jgi:hypothetical protein